MQRRKPLTGSKVSASRASPSSRTRRAVTVSSGAGRFPAGISRPYGRTTDHRAALSADTRRRRCSAVPPPARHAVSLPHELRDAREPMLLFFVKAFCSLSEIDERHGLLRDGHDRDGPLRAGGQAPIRSRGQRGKGSGAAGRSAQGQQGCGSRYLGHAAPEAVIASGDGVLAAEVSAWLMG